MTDKDDNNQSGYLYVFAAKGLQEFVFRSDQLQEMVGASDLIDLLPKRFCEETFSELSFAGEVEVLTEAAGSLRVLFELEDDAELLAKIWPMICANAAPGLDFVQTIVPCGDNYLVANAEAETKLAVRRNQPRASLPEIVPVVARNPRTGLPAAKIGRDRDGTPEPLDYEGLVKRKARTDRVPPDAKNVPIPEDTIFHAFGFETWDEVPLMFERISGDEREYLAVIHADGNGLGQMFIQLKSQLKDADFQVQKSFYQELSQAIDRAGKQASGAAVEAVRDRFFRNDGSKKTVWPLLPIVQAGDDLTVVIRADLAVEFTREYIVKFAEFTEVEFKAVADQFNGSELKLNLPKRLTAGGGIAFVKPRYPFSSAYELCESLATFAKKRAKEDDPAIDQIPSTLTFHRVTAASTSENFERLLETELTGAQVGEKKQLQLSLAPYQIGKHGAFAKLDDLDALAELLANLPAGQSRELLHLLETDWERAGKHYERFKNNQKDPTTREDGTKPPTGDELEAAIEALTGKGCGLLDSEKRTPWHDALVLAYFKRKGRAFAE